MNMIRWPKQWSKVITYSCQLKQESSTTRRNSLNVTKNRQKWRGMSCICIFRRLIRLFVLPWIHLQEKKVRRLLLDNNQPKIEIQVLLVWLHIHYGLLVQTYSTSSQRNGTEYQQNTEIALCTWDIRRGGRIVVNGPKMSNCRQFLPF